MERIHRDVGTPIWNTMYQGVRGGLAGEIITPSMFTYGRAPSDAMRFMACDPAISTKSTADETAIVVGAYDAYRSLDRLETNAEPMTDTVGRLYIEFVWHGRIGVSATAENIYRAWKHYRPLEVGIEKVAYQSALIELVEERFPEVPVAPVTRDKDKITRFLALGALYEWGRIVHHPDMRGSATELQLARLPNGKHDDIADALYDVTQIAGMGHETTVADYRPDGFR